MRITLDKDFLEIETCEKFHYFDKLEKITKKYSANIVKINNTLIYIQSDINTMYSLLYDITNEFCELIERIL